MIEQTPLVVTEWHYHPPAAKLDEAEKISSFVTLDIMKKRAATKKGIACRFTCSFVYGEETILEYVAEDSYVIDFADVIDKIELLTMIRNSYSKVKEKFDFSKIDTVLRNTSLMALNEAAIDADAILPLVK